MDDRTDEVTARLTLTSMLKPILESGQHDPAAVFFETHPTPNEIEGATDAASIRVIKERSATAMGAFLTMYNNGFRESADPDFDFLVYFIVKKLPGFMENGCYSPLQVALGQMALEGSHEVKDAPAVTMKEKLLEYYRWIVHGRMDETSPLGVPRPDGAAISSAVNLQGFLPSSALGCGPCANCGSPDARARCTGCHVVETSKIVFGIYYCNQDCRASHWKEHKTQCKEVRTLRRASSMFTELLRVFLREAWHSNFVKVTVGQDGITTLQGEWADRRAYLGLPVIRPFPRHLVDSEDQALALLCNSKCREVLKMGRTLFDQLVRHASLRVEEIQIQPKNMPAPYRTVFPDKRQVFAGLCGHDLVRVTLPCGLQFALDATGAQYGWREVLSPWPAYKTHRVRLVNAARTLELRDETGFRDYALGVCGGRPRCEHGYAQIEFNRKHLMVFLTGKLVLEAGLDGGLRSILRDLSDAKFETSSKSMMERMREALRGEVEKIAQGPCEKMYWDQNMLTCITQDEQMYHRLKKVWFTEAEYDELDEKKRMALWRWRFYIATRDMPSTTGICRC